MEVIICEPIKLVSSKIVDSIKRSVDEQRHVMFVDYNDDCDWHDNCHCDVLSK